VWRSTALGIALAVLVGTCGGATQPASSTAGLSGSLTVFAASSLTDAFKKVAEQFGTRHPSAHHVFNFGSSSTLATQILNGAPADVFASADEVNMRKVADAQLTAAAPTFFVANRLQIVVAPGNPRRITGLADLARPDLVVVLAGPTVPVGRYALEALQKAGMTMAPASREVDVRAVLHKVALGEADAGIVYVTDVRSAAARVTGVDIPEQYQVIARYPIALVKGAKNAGLAAAFVEHVLSEEGQRLFAELGFSRP
jgi:molybdate transport system substrate-binding protein